jgi:hypothetical protein
MSEDFKIPPCRTAKKIEVIVTTAIYGKGDSDGDPVRLVTQYWSLDGYLLAVMDPTEKDEWYSEHD